MSSINWTIEQENAITTRGGNLLVSAAAGSGKTAVLVERIIRLVLDPDHPVDLDRLLVVTFTDAAAGEMRHRVGAALARALHEQPDHPQLQRQLALVPRAQISTLHSFCSEVLRSNFYLLGLDPSFRVMDQNEATLLCQEMVEEVLEEFYDRHAGDTARAPFLCLARTMAGRYGDDGELARQVLRLYDFAHSLPRPGAWLRGLVSYLERCAGLPWDQQPWLGHWREMVRLELEGWLADLQGALVMAEAPGGPAPYVDVLLEDQKRLRSLLALVDEPPEQIGEALAKAQKWPTLPRVTKNDAVEAELKDRVQALRNGVKKRLSELQRDYFSRTPAAMLEDLALVTPLVRSLVEVTLRFKEAYQEQKWEQAVVDFTDLEHYALAILAQNGEGSPYGEEAPDDPDAPMIPSRVALDYQSALTEVLVDEYQDTNGVQEAVLGLVSRPGNRFLVGDVKQSIYRFRLADPTLFIDYYRRFVELAPDADPTPGWRLDLQTNFRSRTPVLATVNYLFQRIMNRRVAELDYDARARLNPGATFPGVDGAGDPLVQIHLLDYQPPDNTAVAAQEEPGAAGGTEAAPGAIRDEEQEELDLLQMEARWVARRVHHIITRGETMVLDRGTGNLRPATWRDVVVLMRTLKGQLGVYLEEFRSLGIPVYADGSGGYFSAPEVQTMVALLQVIDNPVRDIPLAAVLRSPLVGLTASHLAAIRLACPREDFYHAVCAMAGNPDGNQPELARRLEDFLTRLAGWRDLAGRVAPADLLEELYRQTGYYDLVGALPGGGVRQANLRALVDRARGFDGTVYRGLFRFLRFVELLQGGEGDLDAARSLGENEDVVRLMSIHKAKGLEFPVVVVSGLGRGFNFTDLNQRLLLHRRLGCGPQVVDPDRGIRYPTVLYRVLRQQLRLENLAEEMRLLYVALTRAREYLIMTAAVRNLDQLVDNWIRQGAAEPSPGPLSAPLLSRAKRPVDWLGPALWSHPQLEGYDCSGETGDGATEHWQVFLWPAPDLTELRQPHSTLVEEKPGVWLDYLTRLEPLPRDWLRQQEQQWPGGPDQLLTDQTLAHRLFWRYPYPQLAALPSKVTVTQWRHRLEEMEEPVEHAPAVGPWPQPESPGEEAIPAGFDLPVFYTGERFDGAERGRVVHLVMQNLVLVPAPDQAGVRQQLDHLVTRGILQPAQRKLVRAAEITRFLHTGLGRRVLAAAKAGRLRREVPFTIGVDVNQFYPDLAGQIPPGETMLLQGIIDCLLVEEEGLVVLDYKTDRVTPEQLPGRAAGYAIQLDLYARAATALTGVPVQARYLYFFHLHQVVEQQGK